VKPIKPMRPVTHELNPTIPLNPIPHQRTPANQR
jgi:hypothetical protein